MKNNKNHKKPQKNTDKVLTNLHKWYKIKVMAEINLILFERMFKYGKRVRNQKTNLRNR